MPFKSQAQRRFFHAAADRGEIPRSTVRRWEKETPGDKRLPEKKTMEKSAAFAAGALAKIADSRLADALDDRQDSRILHMKRLSRMSPSERRRYLADMSARNHPLAMRSG